jgi:hypothetical protein
LSPCTEIEIDHHAASISLSDTAKGLAANLKHAVSPLFFRKRCTAGWFQVNVSAKSSVVELDTGFGRECTNAWKTEQRNVLAVEDSSGVFEQDDSMAITLSQSGVERWIIGGTLRTFRGLDVHRRLWLRRMRGSGENGLIEKHTGILPRGKPGETTGGGPIAADKCIDAIAEDAVETYMSFLNGDSRHGLDGIDVEMSDRGDYLGHGKSFAGDGNQGNREYRVLKTARISPAKARTLKDLV